MFIQKTIDGKRRNQMSIKVEKLNELNAAMSKKKVFGTATGRHENGRIPDVKFQAVFRSDDEMDKTINFINTLNDKDN